MLQTNSIKQELLLMSMRPNLIREQSLFSVLIRGCPTAEQEASCLQDVLGPPPESIALKHSDCTYDYGLASSLSFNVFLVLTSYLCFRSDPQLNWTRYNFT